MENRLGQVIREKRKMLGLSQDKLGELMGVSTGFIGQLERGETGLRIGNLQKLFHLLCIDPNEVFSDQVFEKHTEYHDLKLMFYQLPEDIQQYIYSMIQVAYSQWVVNIKNTKKEG